MPVSNEYHCSYDHVVSCLRSISYGNSRFCTFDVDYDVDGASDDAYCRMDPFRPVDARNYVRMSVRIGAKSMFRNAKPNGMVRDKDLVMAAYQCLHESAHLWQYGVAYMQPGDAPEWIRDMARTRAISSCFDDYRRFAYVVDTSEIFADRYAASQIGPFFEHMAKKDPCFSEVDYDSVLRDHFCQLYGPTWSSVNACRTVNEFVSVFSDMMERAPRLKKTSLRWLQITKASSDPKVHKLLRSGEVMDRVLMSSGGRYETDLLCKYIGEYHPAYFRGLLCIKDEYVGFGPRGFLERTVSKVNGVHAMPWSDLPDRAAVNDPDFDP